jgi:hypothetical protein
MVHKNGTVQAYFWNFSLHPLKVIYIEGKFKPRCEKKDMIILSTIPLPQII